MKKSLACASGGLVALVSLFFAYATISPVGVDISFKDYVTKNEFTPKLWATVSLLFVVLAVIGAAVLLIAGAMALFAKDEKILQTVKSKWLSVAAFACLALSLIIGLLFIDVTAGFSIGIGLGSIIFLIATAAASALHFVWKD